MSPEEPPHILDRLIALPHEAEWFEFKVDDADPHAVGEYLSMLSNSAALVGHPAGYIAWGIENETHRVVGTHFEPRKRRIGNQELENWLATQLSPQLNLKMHDLEYEGAHVVLFEIPCATHRPVAFRGVEYVRVGTYKKKLKDHPEKQRELWAIFLQTPFEDGTAISNASADDVTSLIDYPAYFDATGQRLPDSLAAILDRLAKEKLIVEKGGGRFDITNLGAILFAKDLRSINGVSRKAIRVVIYSGTNRVETVREQEGQKGYAVVFQAELFQLPAPDFMETSNHTKAVLYAPKKLVAMDKKDRIRACYQHACLCYVTNQQMTNASLRKRFGFDDKNYPMASRIIADTAEAELIKSYDPRSRSRKHAKYVPYWA